MSPTASSSARSSCGSEPPNRSPAPPARGHRWAPARSRATLYLVRPDPRTILALTLPWAVAGAAPDPSAVLARGVRALEAQVADLGRPLPAATSWITRAPPPDPHQAAALLEAALGFRARALPPSPDLSLREPRDHPTQRLASAHLRLARSQHGTARAALESVRARAADGAAGRFPVGEGAPFPALAREAGWLEDDERLEDARLLEDGRWFLALRARGRPALVLRGSGDAARRLPLPHRRSVPGTLTLGPAVRWRQGHLLAAVVPPHGPQGRRLWVYSTRSPGAAPRLLGEVPAAPDNLGVALATAATEVGRSMGLRAGEGFFVVPWDALSGGFPLAATLYAPEPGRLRATRGD